MNNSNYNFWKMAFDMRAIDINLLRQAVKTDSNPFGELSEDEFKEISGVDFEVKENKPASSVEPTTNDDKSEQSNEVKADVSDETSNPVGGIATQPSATTTSKTIN